MVSMPVGGAPAGRGRVKDGWRMWKRVPPSHSTSFDFVIRVPEVCPVREVALDPLELL